MTDVAAVRTEVMLAFGKALLTELDESACAHFTEVSGLSIELFLTGNPTEKWDADLKRFVMSVVKTLANELHKKHGAGPINGRELQTVTVEVFKDMRQACRDWSKGNGERLVGMLGMEPDRQKFHLREPVCTGYLDQYGLVG